MESPSQVEKRYTVLHITILVLLLLFVFAQVRQHNFLSFDDDLYVTQNQQVQNGLTIQGVKWAFTSFHASNWHPVTWLSHMADCQFFGLDAGWHHLLNLCLHLGNTLLLYFLARSLFASSWRAFLIAALFGIHPLHVESVAWVSERKDLLASFFGFIVLSFYVSFGKSGRVRWYLLALSFFVLSLMSKPMLVTMPLLLLLLDFWPLNRFAGDKWRVIREKIPFVIVSALSCTVTLLAQKQGGSLVSAAIRPLMDRLGNATLSYVSYLYKMIWPTKLAAFYPFREPILVWQIGFSLLFLIAMSFICVQWRFKKPALLMGWLWYLIALLPVIGIVQVGEQAMADRYSYIPLLGFLFMLAPGQGGVVPVLSGWAKRMLVLAICLVLGLLCLISRQQTGLWHDQYTLFKHAVEVTERNYVGQFQLGNALVRAGDLAGAQKQFMASLAIRKTAKAHNNLAYVLERQGNVSAAIKEYRLAIALAPNDEEALFNLGLILFKERQAAEAIPFFRRVIQLNPENNKAKRNLARAQRVVNARAGSRR